MIGYSGKPGDIKQGDVQPWLSSNGEWTVAGEPESAAWWYPSNDHPSDPALMDVSIRVPAGMEAISVGRLESADAERKGLQHLALDRPAADGDLPELRLHWSVRAEAGH